MYFVGFLLTLFIVKAVGSTTIHPAKKQNFSRTPVVMYSGCASFEHLVLY